MHSQMQLRRTVGAHFQILDDLGGDVLVFESAHLGEELVGEDADVIAKDGARIGVSLLDRRATILRNSTDTPQPERGRSVLRECR